MDSILNILIKLNLRLVSLTKMAKCKIRQFTCRNLLSYVYIPVLQKELDVFRVSVWNNHRVRKQKGKELPTGVPEHIYHCPDQYGGEKCGFLLQSNNSWKLQTYQMC